MLKYSGIGSIALCLFLFSGCGGSSSSGSAVEGVAIDDYVSGGLVCIDANNDGMCGADEESTTTDANGKFVFSNLPNAPLVMDCTAEGSSCVDVATKKPFKGKFSAPAGSTVLSALTTLVHEYATKNKIPADKAETLIKEKLEIPANVDIKQYDPIANSYDTTGQEVLSVQTKVQVLMTGITEAAKADPLDVAASISEKLFTNNDIDANAIKDIINEVTPNEGSGLGSTSVVDADKVAENLASFVDAVPDNVERVDAAKVIQALDENVDEIVAGETVDPSKAIDDANVDVDNVDAPVTGATNQ